MWLRFCSGRCTFGFPIYIGRATRHNGLMASPSTLMACGLAHMIVLRFLFTRICFTSFISLFVVRRIFFFSYGVFSTKFLFWGIFNEAQPLSNQDVISSGFLLDSFYFCCFLVIEKIYNFIIINWLCDNFSTINQWYINQI